MAPMIHCEGAAGRAAGPASKSRGWKTASVVLPLANFIKQLKSSSYLGAAAPRRYHLVLGKTIRSWFIIEIVFNVVLSFQGIYWIDSFLREIIFELTLPHHRNQFNYISVLWRGGDRDHECVFGWPIIPSSVLRASNHDSTQKNAKAGVRDEAEWRRKAKRFMSSLGTRLNVLWMGKGSFSPSLCGWFFSSSCLQDRKNCG